MTNFRQYGLPAVNYQLGHDIAVEVEYPKNVNFRIRSKISDFNLSNNAIDSVFGDFHISSAAVDIRYSPGEKRLNLGTIRSSLTTKFPVFYFTYEHGFNETGLDVTYKRFLGKITYDHKTRFYGSINLMATVGYLEGDIPLHLSFNGRGSRGIPLYEPGVFQTMKIYEFFNTEFIGLFGRYSKSIIAKKDKFNLELSAQINYGLGNLKNARLQTIAKPLDKGYLETGVLTRLNAPGQNSVTIGLFQNIGPYMHNDIKRDMAFVFGVMATPRW